MSVHQQHYEIALARYRNGEAKLAAQIAKYNLVNSQLHRYWQIKTCILVAYATDDWDEAESYIRVAEEAWELHNWEADADDEAEQFYLKDLRSGLDGVKKWQQEVPINIVPRDEDDEDLLSNDGADTDTSSEESRDGEDSRLWSYDSEDEEDEEDDEDDEDDENYMYEPEKEEARVRREAARLDPVIHPIAIIRRSIVVQPSYARMQQQKEKEVADQKRADAERAKPMAADPEIPDPTILEPTATSSTTNIDTDKTSDSSHPPVLSRMRSQRNKGTGSTRSALPHRARVTSNMFQKPDTPATGYPPLNSNSAVYNMFTPAADESSKS